jgi:hypothetical protein
MPVILLNRPSVYGIHPMFLNKAGNLLQQPNVPKPNVPKRKRREAALHELVAKRQKKK